MPLATGGVHYSGVRGRAERASNLFDTFLCGCNCISHFPVVSFRKNAKALPIKPRAMLFWTVFSSHFGAPTPPSHLLSSWLRLAGKAWMRGIQTNLVAAHSLVHPRASLCSRCFLRQWRQKLAPKTCKSCMKKCGECLTFSFFSPFSAPYMNPDRVAWTCTVRGTTLVVIPSVLFDSNMFPQALAIHCVQTRLRFNELIKI